MSRTGWSGSNFLRYGSPVLSGYPITMAAWYYKTATALQSIVSILNSASGDNLNQIKLGQGVGDTVAFLVGDAATSNGASTVATMTNGVWNHLCGVGASATDRAVFLNGANKVANIVNRTASGLDRTSIGKQDNAANNKALDSTARVGEVAIWNVALTDAEVAYLAAGYSPRTVQPGALVAYWPLIGDWSPEIDLIAGQSQTIQGVLTQGAHPPLPYYYAGQQSVLVHPGLGPFNRGRFLKTPQGITGAQGQGSLSVTLADATLAAAAQLALAGTLSQTLANATLSSAATLKIVAALAVLLANATLSSAAAVQIKAALAATLADASLSSAAQLKIQAVLAATLDDATLASIAQSIIHGDLGVTLADAVLVATGNDGWTRAGRASGSWTPAAAGSGIWTPVTGSGGSWTPR